MPFRYPLQPLLRLRRSLERQEEQRLYTIAAIVARLRAQIEQLEQSHLEMKRSVLQEMTAGYSGAAIQFAAVCEAASSEARKRIQAQLEEAERQRLAQLRIYQSARQKREILEGLRDRQEAVYDLDFARREQQTADETYLTRYLIEPRE